MAKLPAKALGIYWPSWQAPALSRIPAAYNVVYLFAAVNSGSSGAITWDQSVESATQLKTDIAAVRAAGRCVMMSVGGGGVPIQLSTTSQANSFVSSFDQIYTALGGVDGVDWDLESQATFTVSAVVVASQQLKAKYGASFAVTYCPAPWDSTARALTASLHSAGVLDLVSPQYYDLSGLSGETAKISNLVSSIENSWLPQVGGDASKIGFGYGIASVAGGETMTQASAVTCWNTLVAKYPTLRGIFAWEANGDLAQNWAFETTFAPLVIGTSPPPPPPPPPPPGTYTVKTGDTWSGIATANGLTLTALMQANPPVPGQVIKL